ncbi:hypothetical protein PIB30_047403 [Stylosanthes scabra]|uniref:Uncharacterized protein n=1 Tax=Stylosanthes scabra TaxID=79078 RepID=A0ABU6RHI9_9FABA|nr:hypothetical protein [Stylosanthes scabra]
MGFENSDIKIQFCSLMLRTQLTQPCRGAYATILSSQMFLILFESCVRNFLSCVRNFLKILDRELTPRGCVHNIALTPKLHAQQRAKGPLSMIKIADTLYPSSFSLLLSFKHSHTLFFPKPIFLYLPFPLSSSSFITTTNHEVVGYTTLLNDHVPHAYLMEHKKNQAELKGKEKVRVPRSPPLKIRTPPLRASPRLAALKDSLFLPSPTSIIMPEKLLELALTAPMTTLPPMATVSKDPIAPISKTA